MLKTTTIQQLINSAKEQGKRLVATKQLIPTKTLSTKTSSSDYRINFSVSTAKTVISPRVHQNILTDTNHVGMFTYMSTDRSSSWSHTSNGTHKTTSKMAAESYLKYNGSAKKQIDLVLVSVFPVKTYLDHPHHAKRQ